MNKRISILLIIILAGSASMLHGEEAAELYKEGVSYLLKKKYISSLSDLQDPDIANALKIFEKIAADYPGSKWAIKSREHAGYTYYKGRSYKNAKGHFSSLLSESKGNQSAGNWKFMLAEIDYKQKDYSKAKKKFEELANGQAEKILSSSVERSHEEERRIQASIIMIAECLLMEEDYQGAIDKYRELIEKYPESPFVARAMIGIAKAQYSRAYKYYADKDYNQALEYLNGIMVEYDKNKTKYMLLDDVYSDALFVKAEILLEQGSQEEVIKILERIVEEFRISSKVKEAKKKLEELK